MIYFTSDWHFCHDKPFIYEPRGFNNVYDMNKEIIKRHNILVNDDDDVYCLGDCMLSNNDLGISCIKQLKGKIHIIKGNHDTDKRIKLYESCYNVVEVCDAKFLKINKYNFFLSHFPCITSNFSDTTLKTKIINLCGHSHTTNKFEDIDKGIIYHVEVDAHDIEPISIEDIMNDIKNKSKGDII